MTLLLLLIGVAILIIWAISIFNRLVKLKNVVDEAWSGVDVQLKRRRDLVPNLVQTVKQYNIHEASVLEKVTAMRAAASQPGTIEQQAQREAGLGSALRQLMVVIEKYPELKANQNFLNLMQKLSELEHEIQLARRFYNGAVRDYNVSIQQVPSNIIANTTGFSARPYFELADNSERNTPKVTFDQ